VKAPETDLIAPLQLNGTPLPANAKAPLARLLADHADGRGEMSARDLFQRYGRDIDAFYAQLKREVAHGWIAEPRVAEVREKLVGSAPV
jgi:type I restriction enzyme S subunit